LIGLIMNSQVKNPEQFSAATAGRIATPKASHEPLVVIGPSRGWQPINFRELWHFRGLIYHFIWRDVKVRYKHTLLGIGWAILQPLMMMLVFTTYFSLIRGIAMANYTLFIATGIMPWLFFQSAVITASHSVINSEHLITKIYFPRLVVTFSSVGVFVVDFVISFGLLFVIMAFDGKAPTFWILLAPVMAGLLVLAALAVGIALAALNITYKDFKHVIPFMMQLWFFATPIIFFPLQDIAGEEKPPESVTRGLSDELLAASYKATPSQTTEAETVAAAKADPTAGIMPQVVSVKAVFPAGFEGASAASKAGSSLASKGELLKDPPPAPPTVTKYEIVQHQVKFRAKYDALMLFNPISSIIVSYRCTVMGQPIPWGYLAVSVSFFISLFLVGSLYFRKVEDQFADII
jgi:lipopolysaccharide transport system permease protein